MKNIKKILFFVLISVYAAGVCIGSISQIKTHKQDEMYEYLAGAVTEYKVTVPDSIKSVAKDNAKTLLIMMIFAFFKVSGIATAVIILLKGYSAGFAITTMLRLYGIKGLFFCSANLISALILIPALSYYGGVCTHNLINYRDDRKVFLKKYLYLMILLTSIFCVDSVLRGFFSSIFMRLAASMAKAV